MDSLPSNDEAPNLELIWLKTKLLILLEVKPPPDEDANYYLELDRSFILARASIRDQLQHYFLTLERESAMKVIAIASVGKQWQWAVLQRVAGTTPANESDRAAVPFKDDRQFIVTFANIEDRPPGWSPSVTLRTPQSDLEFEEIFEIRKNFRLKQ